MACPDRPRRGAFPAWYRRPVSMIAKGFTPFLGAKVFTIMKMSPVTTGAASKPHPQGLPRHNPPTRACVHNARVHADPVSFETSDRNRVAIRTDSGGGYSRNTKHSAERPCCPGSSG